MIFEFFRSKLGPPRNMRRKNPSRLTIPVKVGLKEAKAAFTSFALKFRANRKMGKIFPPHVSRGTPAFLKITFQLHRNPTVLLNTVHDIHVYIQHAVQVVHVCMYV